MAAADRALAQPLQLSRPAPPALAAGGARAPAGDVRTWLRGVEASATWAAWALDQRWGPLCFHLPWPLPLPSCSCHCARAQMKTPPHARPAAAPPPPSMLSPRELALLCAAAPPPALAGGLAALLLRLLPPPAPPPDAADGGAPPPLPAGALAAPPAALRGCEGDLREAALAAAELLGRLAPPAPPPGSNAPPLPAAGGGGSPLALLAGAAARWQGESGGGGGGGDDDAALAAAADGVAAFCLTALLAPAVLGAAPADGAARGLRARGCVLPAGGRRRCCQIMHRHPGWSLRWHQATAGGPVLQPLCLPLAK